MDDTIALGQFCTRITKGTTPTLSEGGFTDEGVNYIKSECLNYDGRIDEGRFSFVSPETHNRLLRSKIEERDILYSIAGANLGKCGLAMAHMLPANTNQAVAIIRVDTTKASPEFISYVLRARSFVQGVLGSVAQSAQPNVNLAEIGRFRIPYWPISTQTRIAETLSALDENIELNRRMNDTLEAMAQAIFRDWFVDFGPIRRKLAGATDPIEIMGGLTPDTVRATELAGLFPDALDDAGLPLGWIERPLDQIAEFLNGLALQKYPAQPHEPSLPVVKIAELRGGLSERSNRAASDLPKRYIVHDGDFLFSWSGSLMAKVWTEGDGALNQHLFKVTSTAFPQWFLARWVFHHMPEFQSIAASKATTMGHIQRGHLSAAKTVCPPATLLIEMTKVMGPLWERAIHNDLENRTLAETRDYLLPRLMSGEVRLSEAADEIPA